MNVRGFSLVELSIVLVILGLLTGGILSGQSLIRAAELRAVTSEYQIYNTAFHTFRDRYRALPGDMHNATSFWGKDNAACSGDTGTPATPGTCNGNGDGRIPRTAAGALQNSENMQIWKQLSLAGLIEGTYTGLSGSAGNLHAEIGSNVPVSKLKPGGWTVRYLNDGNYIADSQAFVMHYGNTGQFGGQQAGNNGTTANVLKPEEAWNIDTKLDDGRPAYGKIIGYPVNNVCIIANSGTLSNTNFDASYNVSETGIRCSLLLPFMM